MSSNKDILVDKSIKYSSDADQYSVKLRKPRSWWWLLLLLLPLLLLIKCERNITVTCIDGLTGEPAVDREVSLDYVYHNLADIPENMLLNKPMVFTDTTDTEGKAHFTKLPCTVFSYIFYCMEQATATVVDECGEGRESFNFHYTKEVTVTIEPRLTTINVRIVDDETGDPLPDASLIIRRTSNDGSREEVDSVRADAAGVATIPDIRLCSAIELMRGTCYGYADTTRADVPVPEIVVPNDSNALRLRPIKERFTFFVKNKDTREPIPDATCTVTLTHPNGTTSTRVVHTSVDGKGIAVYDAAFVLSTISITASKVNFYDGELEGGPFTVEQFVKQPDDVRTVWLKPKPLSVQFVDVDSINGKPLAGVTNVIEVTHPDGKKDVVTETSNSNGIFPVCAEIGSKIVIKASRPADYHDGHLTVDRFDGKGREVPLAPKMGTLQFRTIDGDDGSLLPDCALSVSGSISGGLAPSNSGDGNFSVTMRVGERLSITASKSGYITNSTTVSNNTYDELFNAPQSRRDIPLKVDIPPFPPCDAGNKTEKSGPQDIRTYSMGQKSGTAILNVDMYPHPDELTVYDGPDTSYPIIFPKTKFPGKEKVTLNFHNGAVTIVIDAEEGSSWEYFLHCPD